MDCIRVLQISYDMSLGGAETLIMNLYRNIDRDRIQFDFLLNSHERSAYEDEIESLGGRIYRIPRYLGYNAIQYDKALKSFLLGHPEHRVIHDHLMDSAAHTLRLCRNLGRIAVAHSHIANVPNSASEAVRSFFRKDLWRVADHRFACSDDAGNWLYRGKAPYTVLRNGIVTRNYEFNEDTRARVRKVLGLDDRSLLIGTIGRMVEQKNQVRLLEIFREVQKIYGESKLALIGQGPLESRLKARISELGIAESVILTGPRKDVNELLMAMDRFVLPSLFEGLGIVLVEAQASGLPCIFTDTLPKDVDLIPELIHRVSLSAGDCTWAETICGSGTIDRKPAWERVGEKGYDIRTSAKQLQEFYLGLNDSPLDSR